MNYFNKSLYLLGLLFVALCLGQCSSINLDPTAEKPKVVPSPQRSIVWQKNKAELNALKNNQSWGMTARLGVITKEQSASSQLDWSNQDSQYNIKLNNALTFGEVKISHDGHITKLFYDNKEYVANNPEELLLKLTQINLPISELHYWILGLPSPNYKSVELNLNEYATLSNLKQAGFIIKYDNFGLFKNRYILPHKIIIKSKNLYLKISVEHWDL